MLVLARARAKEKLKAIKQAEVDRWSGGRYEDEEESKEQQTVKEEPDEATA